MSIVTMYPSLNEPKWKFIKHQCRTDLVLLAVQEVNCLFLGKIVFLLYG